MKFRLVYDGALPPADSAGSDLKHEIRQQLHPQLRTLWQEDATLRQYATAEINEVADEYREHGFRFVPLVRIANRMACRLDILMLMRQEPLIFSGKGAGDLDNRVKTLMDGLRMPTHQRSDLGSAADAGPRTDEDPLFCLMDDDKGVYEISVATDRLLAPIRPDQKFRDVIAIINVHVTSATRHDLLNLSYEGFGVVKKTP